MVINKHRAQMCSGEKWTSDLHLSGSGCHGLKQPGWKWRGEIAIEVIKGWTLSSVDAWITFHYLKLGCKWTSPLIYNGTFQSVRPELKTWKAVYVDESSRKDLNPEEQPAPALLGRKVEVALCEAGGSEEWPGLPKGRDTIVIIQALKDSHSRFKSLVRGS